jgi:DNA (cytosine-5)-methyltransferase 1
MDLGLERAGIVCKWQVEIDEYATRVLQKHWPSVPRHRDVREVGSHNLEPVDVVAGGFPCQDISTAGKGVGIEGAKSGLWAEYARIVSELRPRYVLVENVSALLNRGVGRVLGDLASLGYDAEWDCIPAASVGAPHLRDRIFIVAYPSSTDAGRDAEQPQSQKPINRKSSQLLFNTGGGSGADKAGRHHEGVMAYAHRESLVGVAESRGQRGEWRTEPDVGRVAHGVPRRVDRLRGLGNAVVPQVAEWIGRRIVSAA